MLNRRDQVFTDQDLLTSFPDLYWQWRDHEALDSKTGYSTTSYDEYNALRLKPRLPVGDLVAADYEQDPTKSLLPVIGNLRNSESHTYPKYSTVYVYVENTDLKISGEVDKIIIFYCGDSEININTPGLAELVVWGNWGNDEHLAGCDININKPVQDVYLTEVFDNATLTVKSEIRGSLDIDVIGEEGRVINQGPDIDPISIYANIGIVELSLKNIEDQWMYLDNIWRRNENEDAIHYIARN